VGLHDVDHLLDIILDGISGGIIVVASVRSQTEILTTNADFLQ